VWRKNRVKKIKKFIDHMLLLFNFEKKYFDDENIKNTFVGHPLIEKEEKAKTVLNDLIKKDKKIISIFPGSRKSETSVLLPILLNFVKLMNKKDFSYSYVFHATDENKEFIVNHVKQTDLNNIDVISDDNIKSQILSNSIFAVSKSGTVSLQISSSNVPSIIIYKLSFINFMIFKLLVNVKFANIINIINDKEVIPELLQKECNAEEICRSVIYFLKNPKLIKKQLDECSKTLEGIKSKTSSSNEAATILSNYLIT
jgi:lipid-A-disaccharide synthase